MKSKVVRQLVTTAIILVPAGILIAITWIGTTIAINSQRQEAEARIIARAANQAQAFQMVINRQILDLDQALGFLADAWEDDPRNFDLHAWRKRAVALSDISLDVLLADNRGRVLQSTVPEFVGETVINSDFFAYAVHRGGAEDPMYIGPATAGRVFRRWHMDVARWMRSADGSIAGIIVADWRISAITDLFRTANLGPGCLIALVGLTDGKLRAVLGAPSEALGQSIAGTPMFAALQANPDSTWTGRSASDGVERIHAFHRVPGRDLAVLVGISSDSALAPEREWEGRAQLFAGCITFLIGLMCLSLLRSAELSRRRLEMFAYDRTVMAAANAQLEGAKARTDAKSAQLEATLDGMSDGVVMVDAQFCLVEWNHRFPELAGIPANILRVGLPMEELLRAQARSGQFGTVDVEAEVARRMALLRSGAAFGTIVRSRPDGRVLELRRNPLPDGGFVTLFADVTARKREEDALREARAIAENANEAKSRFVAIVSHEIRNPLNALLNTLSLIAGGTLAPPQRALLDVAMRSGDALLGLINDILEMSRIEAGQLNLRPSAFGLRTLLEGVLDMFRPAAAERGITLVLGVEPALPADMYADSGRMRQVLINLLSNAVKFGQAGFVGLFARQEHDLSGRALLYIAVRDHGPMIEEEGRARLFQPFSRLDQTDGMGVLGSGLGLAICRHLTLLMGGSVGCDPWRTEDGQVGNEFWVRLPLALPPAGERRTGPAAIVSAHRFLPRSRILLVEDILANQIVTATLLRRAGHMVDIAHDGEEALRVVARQPYDLVFLDIFMPGMSGFDVARRVRAMAAPSGVIPIVALTANVAAAEEAMCREAGINRLLGKPVSLDELQTALADLVWRGRPGHETTTTRATADESALVLSEERIDELRTHLSGEVLNGMVESCLVDLQARLPDLRRSLAAGDVEALAVQVHAMIGMAAGYGMSALEGRLRSLMQIARGNNIGAAGELAEELELELARAAVALREALAIEVV